MVTKHAIMQCASFLVVLTSGTISTVFYAAGAKNFSHVEHAEYGAECDNCHVVDGKTGRMTHLDDGCTDCHEPITEVVLKGKSRQPPLRFSHETHVAAFDCADCHGTTISDTHQTGKPLLTAARCDACHEESGIELGLRQCRKCHHTDARKMPPGDHTKIWKQTHGLRSPWGSTVHERVPCQTCHQKSQCVTCHRTTKPKSHTGLWRLRTHGLSASFDRDRCKTCHETGSCVFCHRNTRPLNHRGPWKSTHGLTAGSRGDERCLVCHSKSECRACHGGGQ